MSDFERDIVRCMNLFFKNAGVRGFSYRLKQARFNSQYVDVLSDSLDPRYYLAIECKSLRDKKIYFTQHFHRDKNDIHQVDLISDFLSRTGRSGFLAVEFRAGPGRAKEAYLVPWERVKELYLTSNGLSLEECRCGISLGREEGEYVLSDLYPK